MLNYISEKQLEISAFKTPFPKELSADNRWVKLASIVPWEQFANKYVVLMSSGKGRPGISPRTVLGALIIKHMENLSDEKTIQAIQENVYMQFFVGLSSFQTDKIFDASLFVTIRKRIGKEDFDALNTALIQSLSEKKDLKNNSKKTDGKNPPNSGKLQADATVADQYISFPTDSKLLNCSRKKLETFIDKLYCYNAEIKVKPRTYRRKLDRDFLIYSKKKNKTKSAHRTMKRRLLESVKRNLKIVDKLLPGQDELEMGKDFPLTQKEIDLLVVIQKVYKQQKQMYDDKVNTCADRIVSLDQPHVRPILRGKQNARVEFGAKLSVSLDHGFAFLNMLRWNAFSEGKDLQSQIEEYFKIHGHYPELVQVDKAYPTRENRAYLKDKNIRITAPTLGRKPKIKTTPYQKAKQKREATERNHIEGKFGQAKNGYNLNKIRARRRKTSETWISCIFFIMNLINYLKKSKFGFKSRLILSNFLRKNTLSMQHITWNLNWVMSPKENFNAAYIKILFQ